MKEGRGGTGKGDEWRVQIGTDGAWKWKAEKDRRKGWGIAWCKKERELDVEWGNKREEDRDDMPEADSSADLEVNPISEIGVYGSCVL